MSTLSPVSRRARRRRRRPGGFALRALAFAAVLAFGVALGSALDDNPDPGRTQTYVRTLTPRPLAPSGTTTTVTITVTTG